MTQQRNDFSSVSTKPYRGHVVVVGASSGGTEALEVLLQGMAADLPACILIVRHLSPEASALHLARRIKSHTRIHCDVAKDGEPLKAPRVYVAPADNHLLIDESKIWIVHGPRENRWRPAVDTLFRSAAVSHGNRVIGIVLSGSLDDGTAGLSAIKRCGGRCIVQEPNDAAFPDMPESALSNVSVDHCVPAADIPGLLAKMLDQEHPAVRPIPEDILAEARIARSAHSDMAILEAMGERSVITCPDCGGVLWEMNQDGIQRYRCHTGHSFSAGQLLEGQVTRIEETIWRALRMFEERRNLLKKIRLTGQLPSGRSADERIEEADHDIERLRKILRMKVNPPAGSKECQLGNALGDSGFARG